MSKAKKQARVALAKACALRDNNVCKVCKRATGSDDEYFDRIMALDTHHITPRAAMPNLGNVPENCVSLCGPCHDHAEDYLAGDFGEPPPPLGWQAYAPSKLYALIGSSYEAAKAASEAL